MASIEEICSEALGLIGENPIADITANETKAIRCNQFWATTRDACLRHALWNFARKRVTLVQLSDTPAFGYAYAYQQPADCIRLWVVTDDATDIDSMDIAVAPVEYKLESGQILCDSEALYALYARRVEETGLWAADFVEYMAASLAAKVAAGLTKSAATVQAMLELAEIRRRAAVASNAREAGTPSIRKQSSWKDAR